MGHVVTADGVSFRDPDDGATRRDEQHFLYASRGMTLPENVDQKQIDSLLAQGAVAEEGSDEAKLALAGAPRTETMRRGPGQGVLLSSEGERVRAAQSAAQFHGGYSAESAAGELAKLPFESLTTMAKAFAVEVTDDDTKVTLAQKLAQGGKDAPDATPVEETAEARSQRDSVQLAARETAEGASVRAAQAEAASVQGDGDEKKSAAAKKSAASSSDK